MRTLTYAYDEALAAPAEKNGLVRRGWIWRSHAGTLRWNFTSSIDNASRSYPSGAEFVPVYVEERK